jgi:hypothetical protein
MGIIVHISLQNFNKCLDVPFRRADWSGSCAPSAPRAYPGDYTTTGVQSEAPRSINADDGGTLFRGKGLSIRRTKSVHHDLPLVG